MPNLLRDTEYNVGELAQLSVYSAANVSRHLSYLAQHGMVARESRGPACSTK
jgi:DNA-binding transcriptional ArsR family regulator